MLDKRREIEWQEKEYGTSESSRVDAIMRKNDLKRRGYIARVVYGNRMQFIVQWRKRVAALC